MAAHAQQETSYEQHPAVVAVPNAFNNLASLLEDESIFLMVFEHLVEHGLRNCRLVCRRWKEACKQFPIRLEKVDPERLDMFDSFPNTTSLSIGPGRRIPIVELCDRLSSLNNLKSFTLQSDEIYYDGSVRSCFQPMVQLTDLAIVEGESRLHDILIASVRDLTNLTRLRLHTSPPRRQVEPFVELQKIHELDVNTSALFNRNGASMFPSLTNLTRLSFEGSQIGEEQVLNPLEAISIYASSLKCLVFKFRYQERVHVDCAPLTCLTNLQTLTVFGSRRHLRHLAEVLPQLHTLTDLGMRDQGRLNAAMRASIAMCTGLKALDCAGTVFRHRDGDGIYLVPYLTQLTEITADCYGDQLADLSCLVLLQRLDLIVLSERDCSLNEALSCMSSLRSIDVQFMSRSRTQHSQWKYGVLRLSGSALSDMRHLKSLSLYEVDVDESFFRALSSNGELTKLEFLNPRRRGYTHSFMHQVNTLRNLEELKLRLNEDFYMCDLLSPEDLSKLKRLNFNSDRDDVKAVRRKFNQSIRRVLVNGDKKSAWCSRFAAS